MFLKVPDIGDDFKEAVVVEWLVTEGSVVSEGQDLVELVTDKASFVVPSPVNGVLERIHKGVGEALGEDMVLAEIREGDG